MSVFRTAPTLFAAALLAAPAHAITLAPGGTVDTSFYFDYEVAAADPDWYGTTLSTTYASATETRDGIVDFEPDPIPDLYSVTGDVKATVTEAANGQLVFGYTLGGSDDSFVGINGPVSFSVSGFAGYDLDFGWTVGGAGTPIAPLIERSADGDTILFALYFDPYIWATEDVDAPLSETYLFTVGAPDWSLSGTGEAGLYIDTFGIIDSPLIGALPAPGTAAVPLPAGILLLGSGLAGLTALRRKRRA